MPRALRTGGPLQVSVCGAHCVGVASLTPKDMAGEAVTSSGEQGSRNGRVKRREEAKSECSVLERSRGGAGVCGRPTATPDGRSKAQGARATGDEAGRTGRR